MALRLRRGTDAERLLITPQEGELVYTTDSKKLFVGDGSTTGGVPVDTIADPSFSLDDLTDVNTISNPPGLNQALIWNGSQWVPGTVTGAGGGEGVVEGQNYRINIVADDSSVMVDTATSTFAGDITGSVFAINDTLLIDADTGNIPKANIEDSANWDAAYSWGDHNAQNYVRTADIVDGTLTVDVNNTGDLQGSVFADDSTLLVDGVAGKIVGEVENSIVYTDVVYARNSDLYVNADDQASLYLGATNSQTIIIGASDSTIYLNGNQDSNVGAGKFFSPRGTDLNIATLDMTTGGADAIIIKGGDTSDSDNGAFGGNVFINGGRNPNALQQDGFVGIGLEYTNGVTIGAYDFGNGFGTNVSIAGVRNYIGEPLNRSVTYLRGTVDFSDATVSNLDVQLSGDLTGSVFADDSTLLVDGVNGTIPYSVLSDAPTALSDFSNDLDYAGIVGNTIALNGLPVDTFTTGDLTVNGNLAISSSSNITFETDQDPGTWDNGSIQASGYAYQVNFPTNQPTVTAPLTVGWNDYAYIQPFLPTDIGPTEATQGFVKRSIELRGGDATETREPGFLLLNGGSNNSTGSYGEVRINNINGDVKIGNASGTTTIDGAVTFNDNISATANIDTNSIVASSGTLNIAGNDLLLESNTEIKLSSLVNPVTLTQSTGIKFADDTVQTTAYPGPQTVFDGDVTGSVFADDSTTLVDGVNGVINLNNTLLASLSNVSDITPNTGQYLRWDGTHWTPSTVTGGGSPTATITGATQADPVVITTDGDHNFADSTFVTVTDVTGMTELNGNSYYIDVLTTNTFALYTDISLSTSVNGSGYTAYVSGGSATALESTDALTLAGQGASYYLDYDNFSNTPSIPTNNNQLANGAGYIVLTDVSVGADAAANGTGGIAYNNISGVFTYTPPDLSGYAVLSDLSVVQNTASGNGTLAYNNGTGVFTYTPPDLSGYSTLTDFSVGADAGASGTGGIAYNNTSGVFTYTPPDLSSYLTSETVTSLSIETNTLTYTDETGSTTDIDLSLYLDDTNLARLTSGTLDSDTGIATFTRDDASTFTVDFSALLNVTLADLSVTQNTASGNGTLTYNNSTGVFTYTPPDLSSYLTSVSLNNNTDVNFTPLEPNDILRYTGSVWSNASASEAGLARASDLGDFDFTGTTIDTAASAAISITPEVTINNNLTVANTVFADSFVTTGTGSSTLSAGTNLNLTADNAVIVTSSPLRLASFTTTARNAIAAQNGDIIYNTDTNQIESYENGAWAPIDTDTDTGITEISQDTTPQLGGDLDVNGNTIRHTFVMGANGTSDYTFSDSGNVWFPTTENDPVLYLRRGETYVFTNNSGGAHPFEIRLAEGGAAYNTGVTNNGAATGNIVFSVPMSAPSTLYYQCTNHSSMGNTINIV